MAANLRAKLGEADQLLINDRNADATTRFVQEVGTATGEGKTVQALSSAREVAEKSVSSHSINHELFLPLVRAAQLYPPNDEIVLQRSDLSCGIVLSVSNLESKSDHPSIYHPKK